MHALVGAGPGRETRCIDPLTALRDHSYPPKKAIHVGADADLLREVVDRRTGRS
jgi:hypothetical protein